MVNQATLREAFNEIDLEDFLKRAAFVDANNTLTINGSVNLSDVFVNLVETSKNTSHLNDIELTNILLDHVNQTVSGNASFNNFTVSTIMLNSLINGVNLTEIVLRR